MDCSCRRAHEEADIRLGLSACVSFIVKLPVWSTPTCVKGATHCTRSAGKGGGSGRGSVLPLVLWHVTRLRRRLLMCERILGAQHCCLYKDNVCDKPT